MSELVQYRKFRLAPTVDPVELEPLRIPIVAESARSCESLIGRVSIMNCNVRAQGPSLPTVPVLDPSFIFPNEDRQGCCEKILHAVFIGYRNIENPQNGLML
jgi:hypothetical protein